MEETAPNTPAAPKTNPFTTVTPFSKVLALVLFIALPFVGFWLGIKYQSLSNVSSPSSPAINSSKPQALVTPRPSDETVGWKTYVSTLYKYSLSYPSNYSISSCRNCFDLSVADFITLTPPGSSVNAGGFGYIIVEVVHPATKQTQINLTVGNGIKAYANVSNNGSYEEKMVSIPIKDGVINISVSGGDSPLNRGKKITDLESYKVFDQILSTFKFLP